MRNEKQMSEVEKARKKIAEKAREVMEDACPDTMYFGDFNRRIDALEQAVRAERDAEWTETIDDVIQKRMDEARAEAIASTEAKFRELTKENDRLGLWQHNILARVGDLIKKWREQGASAENKRIFGSEWIQCINVRAFELEKTLTPTRHDAGEGKP